MQHNVLRPFPDEHLGKYDFVHVRLLIAALKEDDIPIALENVVELLGRYHSPFFFLFESQDERLDFIFTFKFTLTHQTTAPGGYIQWDEWDFPSIQLPSAPPTVKQTLTDFLDFCTPLGFARDIARNLHNELSQDSTIDQHFLSKTTWYSLRDEETMERSRDVARVWWLGAVKSLWPIMLARKENGEAREEGEIRRIVGEKVGIMAEVGV